MSKFKLLHGDCPVCGGIVNPDRNGKRDCRENAENGLVHCRSATSIPYGWRYIKDDDLGFGMYAQGDGKRNSEEWERQRAEWAAKRQAELEAFRMACMPPETRSGLYATLIKSLPLTLHFEDESDLNRRGVTLSQIERWQIHSVEKWQKLAGKYDPKLPGVGHDGQFLWTGYAGYVVPTVDPDGRVTSLGQIWNRNRDKSDRFSPKYPWLSGSSDKNPGGMPPTLPNGELPLQVMRPEQVITKRQGWVGLCEGVGVKPGLAADLLGFPVIGASGGNFASSADTLKNYLDRLDAKHIMLLPDAGAITNPSVMRSYTSLAELSAEWGYSLKVLWWGQFDKTDRDIDDLEADDIQGVKPIDWVQFAAMTPSGDDNAPEELTAEDLREAVEEYAATPDPFDRAMLSPVIKKKFSLTEKKLQELVDRLEVKKEPELVGTETMASAFFANIEARQASGEVPGLFTGFYDLDNMISGFQRGDLIVVAGRPSMGKSTFALQCIKQMAEISGKPGVIFSLEMPKEQLMDKMMACEAGVNLTNIRTAKLSADEMARLAIASGKMTTVPVKIDDTPMIEAVKIEQVLAQYVEDHGSVGCIMIDYLQIMGGEGENEAMRLARITCRVKAIARRFEAPVLLLSQLSREVEHRTNKRPIMSDLRGSGAIEQDADQIIFAYRDEYYDKESTERGVAEFCLAKNRNGETGTIKLLFEPEYSRFRNMA